MEVASKEGKYIYCIIGLDQHQLSAELDQSQSSGSVDQSRFFGPLGIGGRGDELYAVCFDDIAAVVSNAPIINYSVSRENTLAHEKAIEEAMKEHTVLPVRFATIAKDEEKVKKILEKEHDKFKDLLDKINGKKELGLKAIFKEDVIYKEIQEKYRDIKMLKETIASKPPEQSYYQRVEIGKMVEHALEKEKEIYKEEILTILKPLAEDIRTNSTYGEKMIINAAFLVDEDKETEFDQEVGGLADKYGDKIKFKYVGTLPPFNFVNLVIETGKY